MTTAFRSVLLFSLLCLLTVGVAWGQQALHPADSQFVQNFVVDGVNLQNLSVSLKVPVLSKPGAVPFNYYLLGNSECIATKNISTGTGNYAVCGAGITKKYSNAIAEYVNTNLSGTSAFTSEDFGSPNVGQPWTATYTTLTTSTCIATGGTLHTYSGISIQDTAGNSYYIGGQVKFDIDNSPSSCNGGITNAITNQGGLTVTIPAAYFDNGATVTVLVPNGAVYGSASLADPFGNSMTASITSPVVITDTLGSAGFSYVSPDFSFGATAGSYTWHDTGGTAQTVSEVLSAATVKTTFACSTATDTSFSSKVLSQLTFPDGNNLSFTYETVTGGVTGRIKQITLRTGGTVNYAYGAPVCGAHEIIPSTLSRTTTDGTTTYTFALNGTHGTTTTVLDPGKNKTIYTFQGTDANGNIVQGVPLTLTEVQVYQNTGTLASPINTLLSTTIYCYNNNAAACPTTQAAYPILHKDVYVAPGSKTTYSRTHYDFDSYGNTTSVQLYAAFVAIGAGTVDTTTTITYGSWNGSSCAAVGSNIVNLPCEVKTTSGANTLSDARYTYSSKGFQTQVQQWTNANGWMTMGSASPNTNGTVASTTNALGLVTSYTYGACNSMLPTATSKTVNGIVLTTGETWDTGCNMGKLLSATDTNNHTSHLTYDLFGRPLSQQDPANLYTLTESYTSAVTSTLTDSTYFTTNFNVDVNGLNLFTQRTDGASYDTTSTGQGFNGLVYYQYNTSQPCIAALNVGCTINHFTRLDPLGRQFYEATTGNEVLNTVYNQNDVQTTLTPAPAGENTKTSQTEYDGIGRAISDCAIQSAGGTLCGQIAGGSGILTSYTYAYSAGGVTTTATRGVQVHTKFTDQLGRVKSFTLPESGTTTNYYDVATCPSSGASIGNLTCSVDNAGTNTIYFYDGANRLTDVNAVGNGNCRRYRFDATSNAFHSLPTGYSGTNLLGNLMEAETDNCVSPYTAITDEYFAYDDDSRLTDVWETTPHSGGWYHTQAGYAVNGQLTSISGVPTKSTYTIGLDTNGRPDTSTYGATAVATNVTYNGAGQTTKIDYGTDNDVFGYDANSGLMNNFTYTLGATTYVGTPLWNTNRTLKKLTIVDGFNATDSQTCNFNPTDHAGTGYDDVGRLVGVYCGAVWNQTYAYDQYNNFSKSGTTSWNPGYNSTVTCPTGTICNHITGGGYDSDGQVTSDTNNSFAWDGYHKMITTNSGTVLGSCGGAGVVCLTYDALGQAVEKNLGGTFTEYLYSPAGLTAIMSGQTANAFRAPIPGGAIFTSNATGSIISHLDWLGSARLSATLGHTVSRDTAYSPYGEDYASTGTGIVQEFAGMFTDHDTNVLFDTPNRQFDVSSGSRWLSPDPARASWNAYAYPTNPNSMTDPSGLRPYDNSDYNWGSAFNPGGFNRPCANVDGGGLCASFSGSVLDWIDKPITGSTSNTSLQVTGVSSGIVGQEMSTPTVRIYNNNGVVIPPINQLLKPSGIEKPENNKARIQKEKKTHYLFFNLADWWYQVTGRKWTSNGDGPTSWSDSPDSWSQLETNKKIPAGDSVKVEPTKYLFDDGSGTGLKWVEVGAGTGAGAGTGLSLLDMISAAAEGGTVAGGGAYLLYEFGKCTSSCAPVPNGADTTYYLNTISDHH